MFIITIIMAVLLQYPLQEYERVKVGARTVVVADSFKVVRCKSPVLLGIFDAVSWRRIYSFPRDLRHSLRRGAMLSLRKQGPQCGNAQNRIVLHKLKGKELGAVGIIMLLMSIGGATGVLANPVVPLYPTGNFRCARYDSVVGFAMIYLGSYAGFNVGWGNVFTVGIAHTVAELNVFASVSAYSSIS